MSELLTPDSRKWFVTPYLGTNVIGGIRGPSHNVVMNDKNCELNLIV
jgi:hypothetical protein